MTSKWEPITKEIRVSSLCSILLTLVVCCQIAVLANAIDMIYNLNKTIDKQNSNIERILSSEVQENKKDYVCPRCKYNPNKNPNSREGSVTVPRRTPHTNFPR